MWLYIFWKGFCNEFHDFPTNLHSSLQEIYTDYDIKVYKCIACKNYKLPPIDFYTSPNEDKDLYLTLEKAFEGKITEEEKYTRKTPIRPGTAQFVESMATDSANNGKFVPLN